VKDQGDYLISSQAGAAPVLIINIGSNKEYEPEVNADKNQAGVK
jgi:hypothetical protein